MLLKTLPSGEEVECPVLLYKQDEQGKMQLWDVFPTWKEGEAAFEQAQRDHPGVEFDLTTLSA